MNILLVYYEPFPSGQTTHVLSIAKSINTEKFNLSVIFPSNFESVRKKLDEYGIKNYPLNLKKLFWSYSSILKFIKIVKSNRIDLIHVHSQEAGFPVRIITKYFLGIQVIYTPQTIDIRNKKFHFLYKWLELLFSRITDIIISVNEDDRDRLIKWGINPQKVRIIYNGIDFNQTKSKQINLKEFTKNSPIVLQIGRLSEQKSPTNFILGAELVLQQDKNVVFWMIGEGPLLDEIETMIQLKGLQDFIKVLGNKEDVYNYISISNIVTLTSKWEGLPYSLIEAMMFKKPIVSTNVNGCRELILDGKNGFLVDYNDISSWAMKVIFLLKNPKLAEKFGKEGFTIAKEKYSLQRMIHDIEKTYIEILN